MKIGILTFHRALNYGAVLQCYALFKYMQGIGHEVEIVDYRPEGIEKYRQYFPKYMVLERKGILMKIKGLIVSLLLIGKKKRAKKAFDQFLNNHLSISEKIDIQTTEKLKKYDYLIVGSDQVWSPSICDGFDPIYWGNFSHEGIKILTYAASIGGHNTILDDMWEQIGVMLGNYTSISVREQNLYEQIKKRFSFPATLVVDPTLLLNETTFDKIAVKPKDEKYVLLFNLDSDTRAISISKKISDYIDCRVISLAAMQEFKCPDKGIKYKYSVTPQEFLGFFKYASFIVTSSFHGTVFSVIFQKDFYSLRWEQSDRAANFLDSVGLGNRMLNKTVENVYPSTVDYSGVKERLYQNRTVSRDYLDKAIEI